MQVQFQHREDPLEGLPTHSSILAWKTSWTEEPGGLQSMWSQRIGLDWVSECTHAHTQNIMNEKLLHSSGSSTQCSGKSRKRAVCLQTANSLRCIVQTNTTLSSNYSPIRGFPGNSDGKESACSAGDLGLIPG